MKLFLYALPAQTLLRCHMLEVLFVDMGALTSLNRLRMESYQLTVHSFGGHWSLSPTTMRGLSGRSVEDAAAEICVLTGMPAKVDEFVAHAEEYFTDAIPRRLTVFEGAKTFLAAASAAGIKVILVSSEKEEALMKAVRGAGIQRPLSGIISAENVSHGKPSGELYAFGVKRTPGRALVLESTENGVAAARRAKLPVIAIQHEYNGRQHFPLAGRIVQVDHLLESEAFLAELNAVFVRT